MLVFGRKPSCNQSAFKANASDRVQSDRVQSDRVQSDARDLNVNPPRHHDRENDRVNSPPLPQGGVRGRKQRLVFRDHDDERRLLVRGQREQYR